MTKNSELYNWTMDSTAGVPVKTDKYVQSVKEKFDERSQAGIRKYNTTLEREDLSFLDWLTHLQEELMDATLYVERLKTSYAEENISR
jgi:succinate dehydrogenase flavin-adding protein (antitoxin of CptAB toxin-antitoxin module)